MGNNKRGTYEIRYREIGTGRDGGLGPTRSFLATLSRGSVKEASKKMRRHGVIVGVSKSR